jgi:hypothetical protein
MDEQLKDARAAWEGGRRFAQQFSGFMMAIDLLKEAADIEQATSEAQARLDALRPQVAALTQEVAVLTAQRDRIKADLAIVEGNVDRLLAQQR